METRKIILILMENKKNNLNSNGKTRKIILILMENKKIILILM